MSIPKIEHSIGAEPSQPTSPATREEDLTGSLFDDNDRVETVKVNGETRDSHVGVDKFGREYRYLDDKREKLVPVSQKKKTYMTQDEFKRYVSKVTGSETLPPGVCAEFENGTLIFKLNGEKISLNDVKRLSQSASQRKKEADEKAKEKRKTEFINGLKERLNIEYIPEMFDITENDGTFVIKDSETGEFVSEDKLSEHPAIKIAQEEKAQKERIVETSLAIEEVAEEPTFLQQFNLGKYNLPEDVTDRETFVQYMEEHVNDFFPELVSLHSTKEGRKTKIDRAALTEIIRNNFDIRQKSGATAKDIDARLADQASPLQGMGQAFIDAEKKYGINAWAILGVIGIESSYGKFPAEGTEGNFCGMKIPHTNQHKELKGKTLLETVINNVEEVGYQLKLDASPQRGNNTIGKESKKYCPPNSDGWSRYIAAEILQGQLRHTKKPREDLVCAARGEQKDKILAKN